MLSSESLKTDDDRWLALARRCPKAAFAFVYAVVTTGIYCRPTCPARLARRANVRFYDDPPAALADGFRPCKRCKPDATLNDTGLDGQKLAVKKACECVEKANGAITLSQLAKEVNLSARYLHGIFKNVTGVTPGVYSATCRRRHQQSNLEQGATIDINHSHKEDFLDADTYLTEDWSYFLNDCSAYHIADGYSDDVSIAGHSMFSTSANTSTESQSDTPSFAFPV